jgi:hypothetical protein
MAVADTRCGPNMQCKDESIAHGPPCTVSTVEPSTGPELGTSWSTAAARATTENTVPLVVKSRPFRLSSTVELPGVCADGSTQEIMLEEWYVAKAGSLAA